MKVFLFIAIFFISAHVFADEHQNKLAKGDIKVDTSSLEKVIHDAAKEITKKADCASDGDSDPDCQVSKYTKQLSDYTRYLMFATVGLVLVGVFQFILIWQQDSSTKRIERAYVYVTLDVPEKIVWNPSFVNSFSIKIINHGKTPAILCRAIAEVFRVPECGIPQSLPHGTQGMKVDSGLAIPPSDREEPIPMPYIHFRFTEKEVEKILKYENPGIGVYGMIEYKDIFRKIRKTGFCWELIVIKHPVNDNDFRPELAFGYAKSTINLST